MRQSPSKRAAAFPFLLYLLAAACGGGGDAPAEEPKGGAVAARSDTTAESAASDSTVTLDSVAQRIAGIELMTVAPDSGGALIANGTITYDGNHVSVVASRAEGRVSKVLTDLGRRVRAGDVLALVESPEVGQTEGELERAEAAVDVTQRNHEREKRLYEQSISSQKEMLEAENAFLHDRFGIEHATMQIERARGAPPCALAPTHVI